MAIKRKNRTLNEMLSGGDLIDPNELAMALRVSRPTVYSWVRKGVLPFLKLGELVRFRPEDICQWLEEKRVQ